MKLHHIACAISLCLAAPLSFAAESAVADSSANSSASAGQDGVTVGKMSNLRHLVPAEMLETQAAQQYNGMKQQARQQNALGPDNNVQVMRLRSIANKLIPFALKWNERAPKWQWEVNLLASQQINAFCMPGGKIVFYTGILNNLKLTDDEVALVMGHEIAHALREHGRERMAKSGATSIAAQLAGIGLSKWMKIDPELAQNVTGGAAKLAILKFSREDESEADVVGLEIAARAGYDPRAGVTLWQKMSAANKGAPPAWLSTHPPGTDRIAEIRRHLPEVMPLYAKTRNTTADKLPPFRSNIAGLAEVR